MAPSFGGCGVLLGGVSLIQLEAGESYLVGMPLWLQWAIIGPVGATARWRGVDRALANDLPQQPAAPVPSAPLTVPVA